VEWTSANPKSETNPKFEGSKPESAGLVRVGCKNGVVILKTAGNPIYPVEFAARPDMLPV